MKKCCIMAVLCAASLSPCLSQAALTVVADIGGQDTAAFYEGINREGERAQTPPVPPPALPQGEAAMLPVTTPELTPGVVDDRPLALAGIGALFLVGDDEMSRAWLRQNAAMLAQKHAAGLVVNVADTAGLSALRVLAPGVQLAPASGGELARRLQIAHYPVLITDSGLSSQVTP